jgi:hypothetical protein
VHLVQLTIQAGFFDDPSAGVIFVDRLEEPQRKTAAAVNCLEREAIRNGVLSVLGDFDSRCEMPNAF